MRSLVEMIVLKAAIAFLLFSSAAVSQQIDDLVKEVCAKAPVTNYDCVEAFFDFLTEKNKDIRTLTLLSLNVAMANSSEAMGFVSGMAVNAPPAQKPVLSSCFGALSAANFEFHSAVLDINQTGGKTAEAIIKEALKEPDNCRAALKSANVNIPEVQARCNNVEFFGRITQTTVAMLAAAGR